MGDLPAPSSRPGLEQCQPRLLVAPRGLTSIRRQLVLLAAWLAALLIYNLVALVFLSPNALWSPDEGAKLLQVQNLHWRDSRLSFGIAYTGKEVDPTLAFAQPDAVGLLRVRDGELYFQRLPLFPLLTLPLFNAFGTA